MRGNMRGNRGGTNFENFLQDLLEFYDGLNDLRYTPDSSEIKKEMDEIADMNGVELFREGTNRSVYKDGNYVYKCAHKLKAVQDNIAELENTDYILNHPDTEEIKPHFALSERLVGDSEYILEQEYITPLHVEVDASRNESEAELSLEWLMKHVEHYESIIDLFSEYFIMADVTPRSVFNYGIKSYRDKDALAILDYGYFIPKEGDLICDKCGDVLEYNIVNLRVDRDIDKETVIKTVKSSVGEKYKCFNPSCEYHDKGILAGNVIRKYEEGKIVVDDPRRDSRSRSGGRDLRRNDRQSRSRRDDRSRGRGRGDLGDKRSDGFIR